MTAQSVHEAPLANLSVARWLDALAAGTPAPGGVAAAALAAAMGAALAGMVAGLTMGRPRYAAVEAGMEAILRRAKALRGELTAAADADVRAYGAVMAAYRLPKANESQRVERAAALQAALRRAVETPLAVAEAAVEVLDLAGRAAALGNPNAASDAAVAALLAHAGLDGAARSARSNLRQIKDDAFVQEAEARCTRLLAEGQQALRAALATAEERG